MFYNTQFRGLEPKLYSVTILRTLLYEEIIWEVDNVYYKDDINLKEYKSRLSMESQKLSSIDDTA